MNAAENSMRPVNQAVGDWLKNDFVFRTGGIELRKRDELANMLAVLELHLTLWEAKYQYWIPGEPKHALVYLADEKNMGVGFPSGLDDVVNESLLELRHRWSLTAIGSKEQ